jgi:Ca-activated chloride channel family protein
MASIILSAFIIAFLVVGLPSGSLGYVAYGGLVAPAPVQDRAGRQQYAVTVDVDLVVFNVTVTESGGRHVSGLKARDFRVYEEGQLQDITLFSPEDVPASIGLIIDNSASMHDKRDAVATAALAFVGASNPQDEMFVVNFNENVYLGLPASIQFTNDLDQLHSALLRTAPIGRTALYDALAAGLEHLQTGTRDRKALVVLSDGGDNASSRNLDSVLQMARQSSATIYTIGIYDETNRDRNPSVLRKIANESGGRAYLPASLKDLARVWLDIGGGIRTQYTIGYFSDNRNRDGAFRRVAIVASRNGKALRISTRQGYIAPADKSISR